LDYLRFLWDLRWFNNTVVPQKKRNMENTNDEAFVDLKPNAVWENFFCLTQIPRPSKHEGAIKGFLVGFARNLDLDYIIDEVGNLIIRKPATPGMENRKCVVLQAHLDMVPQKNSDKIFDFTKDPIEPIVDAEWVRANGTTLGADNGVGVAAIMAVLEAENLAHGPIEALFTVDEETGLTGAFGLKSGLLKGNILLNLDSEDEGELYVGCAGATNVNIKIDLETRPTPTKYIKAFTISLTGLKGGHSGVDIHLGRGNAIKLIAKFLIGIDADLYFGISSIHGGSLRNAIPRESFAEIIAPSSDKEKIKKLADEAKNKFRNEFQNQEIDIIIEESEMPQYMWTEESTKRVLDSLNTCPDGVIKMNKDVPGLVETSNNLAVVKAGDNKTFDIMCMIRSSVNSEMRDVAKTIKSTFELAGADVSLDGEYPGWEPNMESEILTTMRIVYQSIFRDIPKIKAIHAGLECGVIGGTYPNLDMISFGPTIRYPHSPDEKVNIASVEKFWQLLVATLEAIPLK
jgi:dipeptidase D